MLFPYSLKALRESSNISLMKILGEEKFSKNSQYTIKLKIAARDFLPRCNVFYNGIPIDSLKMSA